MEIIRHTSTMQHAAPFKLREDFLAPYRRMVDPFQTLLARSTYLSKYCRDNETWTDTIRRVVEGNVSLASVQSEREAEMLFHACWTGQAFPPGRGLWTGGIDGIPADARYNCFAGETRFWADGSLRTLRDAVGSQVEVLTKDGHWRQASVQSFGEQKLLKYRFKVPGQSKYVMEFTATKDHRWFTDRGEVTDLSVGDRVTVTPSSPDISTTAFQAGFIHGLVFGDGSQSTGREGQYQVRLCGAKSQHLAALEASPLHHNTCQPPSYAGDSIVFLRSTSNLKALPDDATSPDYQAGFVQGWKAADGSVRKDSKKGGLRLGSQNATAVQWLAERAPLLGYCVVGYSVESGATNYGPRSAPLITLTLRPEPTSYQVFEIVDEGREEEVFCVVEPETHSFTLEGGVLTGNCWGVTLRSIDDWCWVMNQLMLGGGVGVGLNSIDGLGTVTRQDCRLAVWCRGDHQNIADVAPNDKSFLNGQTPVYRVPDSREGWVEALRQTLAAAFSGKDLIVDVSEIRPRGEPIRTFGGIACGPGPLTMLLRQTHEIVRGAAGRTLGSVECLDITNLVGFCVKSGNVRRSALIVLGDAEDQPFRDAKKDFELVKSHRHTSNNSLFFYSDEQIAKFNWRAMVDDNIMYGEPGLLNLALIRKTDPGATCINPCFAGDTKIAVADGRNSVTIRQLAEEGKDVPVYSVNRETGMIEIKMGRNPRITGYNRQLLRVWLDDGSYLDVTPNHKFISRDGATEVEAKDLQPGFSLPRFKKALEPVKAGSKDYYLVHSNTRDMTQDRVFEHRLVAKFYDPEGWDRVYASCKDSGFVKTGGLVIHHKDYNPLNNSPDNLQIMTFREHSKFHGEKDNAGEANGRWSGLACDEIKEHGLSLTRKLGRRFSKMDWMAYASDKGLPQSFSEYRKWASAVELGQQCASELGFDFVSEDPRVVQTYYSMLEQGYETRLADGKVFVTKTCEMCSKDFSVQHCYRERSFCSETCGNKYINSDKKVKAKRIQGMDEHYGSKQAQTRVGQARICSQLTFDSGRNPNRKEWSLACKKEGVTSRLGPTLKHGYKSFAEVLEAASEYNHKVVRVEELAEEHTVYNITVDDNHTVPVITSERDKRGQIWFSGVITSNCGEIPLHDREACNLAEAFPAKFDGSIPADKIFKLLTRYCLRQRLTPLSDPESEEVRRKNMRLGVALGGLCDFDWTGPQLAEWYGVCRTEANEYADLLGVERPNKVTTVKPSGTISLLNTSSPGIHAPFAPYYIRRARLAANDPMVPALQEAGVRWETDVYDKTGNTYVFEFPMKASHTRTTVQTENIDDQFERQAKVQEWWADNSVSATLSFDAETEKERTAELLAEYVPRFKSTSMLAKSHGYAQAPYETCTEEEYRRMASGVREDHPLIHGGDVEIDECSQGVCPIR